MSEACPLTKALGGKWYGHFGTAACPACQPERRADQTALTLRDGHKGLLLHCKKSECSFIDILSAAGRPARRPDRGAARGGAQRTKSRSEGFARRVWERSGPIEGSQAETYLRQTRMVDLPTTGVLRFNSSTWHGPTRQSLPAMIARVDGIDGFAVSRTYLAPDGSGKANLPKSEQKMFLGAAAGGHVRLKTGAGPLCVAEGIETALSLPHVFSAESMTLWATLSVINMRRLRLPDTPGHMVIAADGDSAGREAGEALSSRARNLGWTVDIRTAPASMDWNDVWIERVTSHRRPRVRNR